MKLSKKKAFTLVELLVVVLVLGVLAGVGVPKFKRMLETRKTGEAEAMLSAVRMEQEKRCIAGKEYRTNLNKLDVLSTASGSKNYTYKLTSTGIVAEAKGKSKEADKYSLQLTSYKEGNICCSGEGCKKLNKNYPGCVALVRDECSADVQCTGAEPAHDKTENSGRCTLSYSQNVECDKDYGNWKESGFVLASKDCECEGKEKDTKTEGRCKIDFTQKCDRSTGEMINYKETGRDCDCEGDENGSKKDGRCTITYTQSCDRSTGNMINYKETGKDCDCDGDASGSDTSGRCTTSWTRECNRADGTWKNYHETKTCTCEGQSGSSTTENGTENISHGHCPKSRTCNTGTGNWGNWVVNYSSCTCDEGYTYNSTTKTCDPNGCDPSQKPNYEGARQFDVGDGYCVTTGHAECTSSGWERKEDSRKCYCRLSNGDTLETEKSTQLGKETISPQNGAIHFHVGSITSHSNGIYFTSCQFNNNYFCKTKYFSGIGSGPVLDWSQSCYWCQCFDGTSNSNNSWGCGCATLSGGGGNSSSVYKYHKAEITSTQYTNCGYPDSASYASELAYQAGFRNDRCYNLAEGEPCKSGYPSCWSHISCGAHYGTSQVYYVEGLVCNGGSGSGGGFPMGSH